jgi:hypothetical protein
MRGVMVPEVRISTINSIIAKCPDVLQRPTQLMNMKQVSSTKGIYNIKVTYSHETTRCNYLKTSQSSLPPSRVLACVRACSQQQVQHAGVKNRTLSRPQNQF